MASSALSGSSKFTSSLNNEELYLELDADGAQLTIELANASRFVVHRQVFNKPEKIRQITGILFYNKCKYCNTV